MENRVSRRVGPPGMRGRGGGRRGGPPVGRGGRSGGEGEEEGN